MRTRLCFAVILLSFASGAFAEASIDQVYQAASSGRLAEAQTMMQEVLKAHPESAKAHFVEAELLLRQNDRAGARAELAKAQAINPSLSFAKPQAVESLKRSLGESGAGGGIDRHPAASRGAPSWVWPVGLGLLVALIVWMVRRASATRRSGGAPMMGPGSQQAPYSPYGAPQPSGGSGLLGSLATGAAIGGGIVAGEALAHRLLDSGETRRDEPDTRYVDDAPDTSMGGNDFGVNDSSGGWDDDNGGGW